MALYAYQAYDGQGKRVSGTIDASSVTDVKQQLARQGLYPITIESAKQTPTGGFFARFFGRNVSAKNKILFTKQLAILLKSGVPLLQAIELLTEQFGGRMQQILIAIKDELKEGTSLADAMSRYPRVFENIYIQLIRAGEASGQLESILERLTDYLERRAEIRGKIRSAMQYPIIQLVIATLVVVVLLTAVVPQMTTLLEAQGQKLPATTAFLIGLSDFAQRYFILLIVSFIALVFGFLYWKRSPSGSRMYDAIKLKLPVVKYIAKTSAVVQFSYALGMLLEGGVNLAESLDIVVSIIDNRILADTLNQARDKIIKQGKIAQYLEKTGIFPPIAIYLIKTGEETGQLDKMLLMVAQNYETELSELIDSATSLLGPIMLVVMAVIVGFIVMSIAGPMMSAGQGLETGI